MKLIPVVCPRCNAEIQIKPETKTCFCTYCGTQIIIEDESVTHIYKKIDEARIREADVRETIELKKLEMEEKKRRGREKIIGAVTVLAALVIVMLLVKMFHTDTEKQQKNDNGLEIAQETNLKTLETEEEIQSDKEDDAKEAADTYSESEKENASDLESGPSAVIMESESDLEIARAGYAVSNGCLYMAVVMHNTSDKNAVEFPTFRCTARGVNGEILGTVEQVLNIIYPGQDYVWAAPGFEVSENPEKVEFEAVDSNEYNVKDVSALSHPEYVSLEIQNVTYVPDEISGGKISGEVYNPNNYDIDQAVVTVVLKDKSGAMLGGELTFIQKLKANNKVPFEIYLFNGIPYSDYEVYANSWV